MPTKSPQLSDRAAIGRLWRDYVWPQRMRLFAAFAFMAILSASTAAYGWLVAHIIDSASALGGADTGADVDAAQNAKNFAMGIVPIIIGITALSGTAMFAQSVLANGVALGVIAKLQKAMFASLTRADLADIQAQPGGHFVSRFTNDVQILTNALLRAMSNLVREILTIIFCFAMMVYFDWMITALVVLVYPLAAAPIIKISKRLRGNAHAAQAQIGAITSQLTESLAGARMVRSYELGERENARLGRAFDERLRLYLKLVTNQARVDPILEVLGGIAIAGVIVLGVYRVSAGATTPGAIAGLLTMIIAVSPRVRALGTLNNVVQEGLAALHRIFGIIDLRAQITEKPDAVSLTSGGGQIEFSNVGFSYGNDQQALTDISFTIKPGEKVALVGPSGGGKSTIFNLLARFYDAGAGSVKIDGIDVRDLKFSALRASMALVSQDITLFDGSIAENIGFGDQSAPQTEIERAARAASAHEFIVGMRNGYAAQVGEGGNRLSGGQRQRISLARAMLRDAPILLLDEATSALDAQAEAEIQAALAQISQGRTVLVIAHRLATVKNADRILVIDNGCIAEQGTHTALLRKKGLYHRLHSMQFG